jgi:hypothetical protein
MTSMQLYLAFPDGVFHYVCAECNALCCRGQGFGGSLRREMQTLLVLYPAIESMAVSRSGNNLEFATPTGRCYFLDADNRCAIERVHGKTLKPGVCVLFPFNLFTRIGTAVAVSPQFMCPLRVQVPARPGQVEGTHALIETAVRESGLLDPSYVEGHLPSVLLHGSENASSVLKREEGFRDACSRALGRQSFIEMLRGESADPEALDGFVVRAAAIMGLDPPSRPQGRDPIDDVLIALAPPLRLNMLRLSPEGILRALALGEMVVRRVLPLSSGPLSPQGVHQIVTVPGPALRLLAQGDEPLDLVKRASMEVSWFDVPEMVLAAFKALSDFRKSIGTLTALEKAIEPSMTVSDRAVLLRYIGMQVEALMKRPARRKNSPIVTPN